MRTNDVPRVDARGSDRSPGQKVRGSFYLVESTFAATQDMRLSHFEIGAAIAASTISVLVPMAAVTDVPVIVNGYSRFPLSILAHGCAV